MRPHAQDFDRFHVIRNLIDQPMLNVYSARVGARKVARLPVIKIGSCDAASYVSSSLIFPRPRFGA
jgi:hypothetical protein